MKITNIKNLLLKTKKHAYYLDFGEFLDINECLDKLCQKIKTSNSIIILKTLNLSPKQALDLSFKIRQLASCFDGLFLIEDMPDIAKIAEADGILLNSKSYPIEYYKEFFHGDKFYAYFVENNDTCPNKVDFLVYKSTKPNNLALPEFLLEEIK